MGTDYKVTHALFTGVCREKVIQSDEFTVVVYGVLLREQLDDAARKFDAGLCHHGLRRRILERQSHGESA